MYAIRPVSLSDLPWLESAAAQAAWESLSEAERRTALPGVVAEVAVGQFRSMLLQPETLMLVAQAGMWPVGFILGAIAPDGSTGEPNGLLINLFVAPAHRRRGVGRQLQQALEGLFRQAGIRKAKLWTGLHNQAAVRLAQGAGYRPEGLIGRKEL